MCFSKTERNPIYKSTILELCFSFLIIIKNIKNPIIGFNLGFKRLIDFKKPNIQILQTRYLH